MKSVFELSSFNDILRYSIPKLKHNKSRDYLQKADLQIRRTKDGKGVPCLDFRIREDLLKLGLYLLVTPTKENLFLTFCDGSYEEARPFTRESKDRYYTGSYKVRISLSATVDFEQLALRYSGKDFRLIKTLYSDNGTYAIEEITG